MESRSGISVYLSRGSLVKKVATSLGTFFRHFDFVIFGTPCKPHFLEHEKLLSVSAPFLPFPAP
jgi:hypothetical protein